MSHYYAKFKENPCVGTDASMLIIFIFALGAHKNRLTEYL